jgi:uncharacterized membrane protein
MLLYLGVLLFAGPHLYGLFWPGHRNALRESVGEGKYKGIYSILSLAGLVVLIMAYVQGRGDPVAYANVYEPFTHLKHLMMLLVLAGFILIAASHGKGYIRHWVKQPMSLGIGVWATGHLLMNGERVVVWIFSTFLVVALLDIVLSTARGKVAVFEPRLKSDIIAVAAGVALFLVMMLGFHPYVLGIPVAR